ncbi:MAG: hypothetical protein IMY67_03790 [Bacteroidetes bacterium]|nr:hypothetical protein [Bacteroidota bacterium]
MSDKKNIDRLFQEKLKDFEATPGDAVWNNISTKLHSTKKGTKGIPIWWKIGGVAATLLLLFSLSLLIQNNNNTANPTKEIIVDTNSNTINNDLQDSVNTENTLVNEENVLDDLKSTPSNLQHNNSVKNKTNILTESNNTTNKSNSRNVTINKKSQNDNRNTSNTDKKELITPFSQTQNAVAENTRSNLPQKKERKNSIYEAATDDVTLSNINNPRVKTNFIGTTLTPYDVNQNFIKLLETNVLIKDKKMSLADEVATNNDPMEDTMEEEFERWKASSNIAPVYFNTFGKGSSIHPQFNNNSKTGDVNMSYGISGSYAINKKLSVRAGLNKVDLGYRTNNVIVFNNIGASNDTQLLRSIKLNENAQNLSFISADEFNFSQVPSVLSNNIDGSIDQKLGFIEVPIELEYKISDKKMGINVIGGFSALFLNNNEVYSVFDGNTILLGEATNINNTSFSANFGLGFDFKISNSFNFNLEPVFKYQLNTFNDTSGNFKPYFIGIYSGFSFKF